MLTWSVRKNVSKSVPGLSARRAQCNNGKAEHHAKVCAAAHSAQAEAKSTARQNLSKVEHSIICPY